MGPIPLILAAVATLFFALAPSTETKNEKSEENGEKATPSNSSSKKSSDGKTAKKSVKTGGKKRV